MINGNKKVIGCAIVEPIRNAFPLVADNEHGSPHSTGNISLLDIHFSLEEINKEPVRCSKVPQPAVCGVSRIWVHSNERRKGVASKLLDVVRFLIFLKCLYLQCKVKFHLWVQHSKKQMCVHTTYTRWKTVLCPVYKHRELSRVQSQNHK